MNLRPKRRWVRWVAFLAALGAAGLGALVLVVLPLGASFLITNASFSFPERDPLDPAEAGIDVIDVRIETEDGVAIAGWWHPGDDPDRPAIVFVHGLNRSRLELVERGAEAARRGFGVLLIDLRNHGASGPAYTTLGVHESRDVCAAAGYIRAADPLRPVAAWGVSLGAASSLLAAATCPDAIDAVIADSSFLSVDDTIGHHLTLITPLPAFPVADLIVAVTTFRMGFSRSDGDVERALGEREDLPVLFIAGSDDVRMPPEVAGRLRAASTHPDSVLVEVPGAGHGRAFETDPERYLGEAFGFLDRVFPPPAD